MRGIYYCYVHIRESCGGIFYVGKGKEGRAWDKKNRNKHWVNTVNKYGFRAVVIKDGMSEGESFALEVALISIYRSMGFNLVNKTNGGEGPAGIKYDLRWRVKNSRSKGGVPIYCSNGMRFEIPSLAEEWLRANGHLKASVGNLVSCAHGNHGSAYGYAWWFEGDKPKEYIHKSVRFSCAKKKPISCSNGMVFKGVKDAVEWLVSIGHTKADGGNLAYAANGRYKNAYGYGWEYIESKRSLT